VPQFPLSAWRELCKKAAAVALGPGQSQPVLQGLGTPKPGSTDGSFAPAQGCALQLPGLPEGWAAPLWERGGYAACNLA